MFHIKLFNTDSEYTTYKGSTDYLEPNLTFVKDSNSLHFVKLAQRAGDIAYWDGTSVKICSQFLWEPSLGTPVGVVVVPEGFAPDGRVRIMSLYFANIDGSHSNTRVSLSWYDGSSFQDTSLPNYIKIPTTDNNGSTTIGSISGNAQSNNGTPYLPKSKYNSSAIVSNQSIIDYKSSYYYSPSTISLYAPSPYLCDIDGNELPNPDFYVNLEGGNALSDFNGLSNTQTLVELGDSKYEIANACWNYTDGVSNLQWYHPALGELAYILPRRKQIEEGLTKINAVLLDHDNNSTRSVYSSTEFNKNAAWKIDFYYGSVSVYLTKKGDTTHGIRPFAIL